MAEMAGVKEINRVSAEIGIMTGGISASSAHLQRNNFYRRPRNRLASIGGSRGKMTRKRRKHRQKMIFRSEGNQSAKRPR